MPELLSPAGNFEKLRSALRFGADAVYLAGHTFGMRAAADNFSVPELYDAVAYAHALGKKVYLTVNVMPRTAEYPMLEEYLDNLRGSGIDAIIAADAGVCTLVRERLPDTDLHISTQAGVVSAKTCEFWQRFGAKRIVLARELTLREIADIRKQISPELELEAFIHGSMCVSYSGRCLLSAHFTDRDANRGCCTQPCRWNYTGGVLRGEITEEKRPDQPLLLEEDASGTYILSSRDLCMIDHIPELMESGIDSFKIEGRMKSAYYTAVTANAYRMAMDAYRRDPAGYRFSADLMREVESVSHRTYGTGFFFESPMQNANLCTENGYLREKAFLAVATAFQKDATGEGGRAFFLQRNKFCLGDRLELLTPGKVGTAFTVTSLFDESGAPIAAVPHPSMPFSMNVPFPVKEGDILRSV